MEIIETSIPGLILLRPVVHRDPRGYFAETYTERSLAEAVGAPVHFVQDNQSRSVRGVLRGLHFQRPPFAQAKLVRIVQGRVLDVAVDLRTSSPTYGRWEAVELSDDNFLQLYIPRGFAHGYCVLSPTATFIYKCDNYYNPTSEGGIRWDDSALAIDWHLDGATPILSPKDTSHPSFTDFHSPF